MPRNQTKIEFIYEPIQEELAKVEENLRTLAGVGEAHLTGFLSHILPSQGKRVRPAVTILASRFHPNSGGAPVIMATAVELLHIASLVHDDTVDGSNLRRGIATVSSLWGRNVAVLLGDYVFATSATWVCDTEDVRVIRRFSETIMELSSGELMETVAAYSIEQNYEQYIERIYNKTASLFRTAGETGAVLSGIGEMEVKALTDYGYNIGMAFQIVDDILDFQGTEEEIGKPVGQDLLQGTLTLPAILLLKRYPNDNPVLELFQGEDREMNSKRAVEMVQNSTILTESYAVADQFRDKAIDAIKVLQSSRERESLQELATYVTDRRW